MFLFSSHYFLLSADLLSFPQPLHVGFSPKVWFSDLFSLSLCLLSILFSLGMSYSLNMIYVLMTCMSISVCLRHLKLSMCKTELQILFSSPNLFSQSLSYLSKLQKHCLGPKYLIPLTSFFLLDFLHCTFRIYSESDYFHYALSPSVHSSGFSQQPLNCLCLLLNSLPLSVPPIPTLIGVVVVIIVGSGES